MQGAQAKGKKKEIEETNRGVADAQRKVDEARVKLDSIAKSKTEDILRSYFYKKTTYDVLDRVVLQFRIDDLFNNQKGEPMQITKEDHKQFVTTTDVNPQDAAGIKAEGSLPDLIELQTHSYKEFLQADQPPSKRKNLGLQAVFTEVFPIESYDGKCVLDFHSYEIGEPKLDWLECLREGLTYGAPLYVTFLLKEEKGTKEEKVFMGELPLMTPQGTFVINGADARCHYRIVGNGKGQPIDDHATQRFALHVHALPE